MISEILKSTKAQNQSWEFISWSTSRRQMKRKILGVAWIFWDLKAHPSDIAFPTKSHILFLPKQLYQLGTQYETNEPMGPISSKPVTTGNIIVPGGASIAILLHDLVIKNYLLNIYVYAPKYVLLLSLIIEIYFFQGMVVSEKTHNRLQL